MTTAFLTSTTTPEGRLTLAWHVGKALMGQAWGPEHVGPVYRVMRTPEMTATRASFWSTRDEAVEQVRSALDDGDTDVAISVMQATTTTVEIGDEAAANELGAAARLHAAGRAIKYDRVKGDAYREARYAKIIAAVEAAWLPSALDPAAEALVAALRAGLAEAPV